MLLAKLRIGARLKAIVSINSWRIGARLAGAFSVVLLLLLGVACVGGVFLASSKAKIDDIVSRNNASIALGYQMESSLHRVAQAVRNLILYKNPEQRKAQSDLIESSRKDYDASFEKLQTLVRSEASKDLIEKIKQHWLLTRSYLNNVLDLADAERPDEAAQALSSTVQKRQDNWFESIQALIDIQEKQTSVAVEQLNADFKLALMLMAGGTLAAIILGIVVGALVTRSITRPMALAVAAAEAVAAGDLSRKLEVTRRDEVGELLASMRKMMASIQALTADADALAQAATEGRLSVRADVAKHHGDFRKVMQGVNDTLDAVIGPLNVAADYVARISNGDIPDPITDSYNGEFNVIKTNLNKCIAEIRNLVDEVGTVINAAREGDLARRSNAEQTQGVYRKVLRGLNDTLEAVVNPINDVARLLGALAVGNLTVKVTGDYKGAFRKLKDDANQTVAKLTEMVGGIRESTEAINVASKEIASGNSDLSSRTEEQASSLEETASSMEELTGTVKQNADNAKQANRLAAGTSEVAIKGGAVVKQVVATMGGISQSSKKIADIIGVIDGIAFQTNILALNAAVEAARAGEQGRGFAVVASEVRNLAQRSAAAAKEIKDLITDSVAKVADGTKLVDEAGKTMEEIVVSVKRVTDIMAEITAASQEQSGGIEQVSTAITQMDEVTQQNAALVEEAAAAAESMEEQAQNLANAVAVFKLEQGATAERPSLTRAAGEEHASVERRGPNRARNVTRLPMAKGEAQSVNPAGPELHTAAAKTKPGKAVAGGAADDWKEF